MYRKGVYTINLYPTYTDFGNIYALNHLITYT